MRGHPPHRKRCKRWDRPWDAHYLTFSCFQRRGFLRGQRRIRGVLDAMEYARQKHGFHLWAYVIMPEHLHVILFSGEAKISPILKSLKLPVARRALLWAQANSPELLAQMAHPQSDGRVSHRFWQRGGGYDRNLRSARDVHQKIAYIHANPVRRGLAASPQGWPWSSWRAIHLGDDDPLRIDRDTIPVLEH